MVGAQLVQALAAARKVVPGLEGLPNPTHEALRLLRNLYEHGAEERKARQNPAGRPGRSAIAFAQQFPTGQPWSITYTTSDWLLGGVVGIDAVSRALESVEGVLWEALNAGRPTLPTAVPGGGMPPELARIYRGLWEEVAQLHIDWNQFKALYGRDPEHLALMNRGAPHFFGIVQRRLLDWILLSIARVTDPARAGRDGPENLSLALLVERIPDDAFRTTLGSALIAAGAAAQFARRHRHKRLAHADRQIRLRESASPLPASTVPQIEGALAAMASLMNQVQAHYEGNSQTAYPQSIEALGDVDAILQRLRESERHRSEDD